MKTVSAKIHSSTPVTISKAASVLSKFVSAETGASQAVNAYLRRATAALDELVRLHSKSDRKKHKKHKSDSSAVTSGNATGEVPTRNVEVSQGPTTGFENGRKKVDLGNTVDVKGRMVNVVKEEKSHGEGNVGEDTERRKKKRKEKSGDVDEGRVGVKIKEEQRHTEDKLGEETEGKKHKKKRRNGEVLGDSEENGVRVGNMEVENKREIKEEENTLDNGRKHEQKGEIEDLKKEDRKKRKNREVEEGSRDDAEEQLSKKKKKRRRDGEDDN